MWNMSYLRKETTERNSNISRNTKSSMVKGWSRSNEMSGVFVLLFINRCAGLVLNPCVGVFLKSSIARYGSFWSCLAFRISCFAVLTACSTFPLLRDKDYLVTVDYYSNFWEIDYVENTLSSTIINKLRSHFSHDMFHISVWNPSLVNSSLANKDFHVLYINSLLLLYEKSEYAWSYPILKMLVLQLFHQEKKCT
jgi:hypothetical protein